MAWAQYRSHEILVLVHGNVTQHVRRHAYTDSRRRWSRSRATHSGSNYRRFWGGEWQTAAPCRRAAHGNDNNNIIRTILHSRVTIGAVHMRPWCRGNWNGPGASEYASKTHCDARTTIIRNHPLTNTANRVDYYCNIIIYFSILF